MHMHAGLHAYVHGMKIISWNYCLFNDPLYHIFIIIAKNYILQNIFTLTYLAPTLNLHPSAEL